MRIVLATMLSIACTGASFAQTEPPLDIPSAVLLPQPEDAITAGGWLLYPSLRTYTKYSDNLFLSPVAPISALGFGVSPSLTAEWTNGIHHTTLFANLDSETYPTDNQINTFDRQATLTQRYSPLSDLTFTLLADYTHKTISNSLQEAIPSPVTAPGTTVLPNGNTVLPNGTILSPSGQPIGQTSPPLSVNTTSSVVNPYDQYTGTFSIDKTFNRGILTLSSSTARTNYTQQSSQDYSAQTFRENGAVWLGPLFYAFSNASVAVNSGSTQAPGSTTTYQAKGGIGFGPSQASIFHGTFYFGHQGSEGTTTAGGDIYGGSLSYYATPYWTLTLSRNHTTNISSQSTNSLLALPISVETPLQVAISASTLVTGDSLLSEYQISPQWTTTEHITHTRIEYIGSTRLDNTWVADAALSYSMWKNLTLNWEYQYSAIISNAPFVSATRNLATMGALYKF